MKSTVIIKSFQNGISVHLDEEADFSQLLKEVEVKFRESSKFFGKAKVVLTFNGKKLKDQEEKILLNTIESNSDLDILCIMNRDEDKNQVFLKAINQFTNDGDNKEGQFYKGTLRSGQVLETDSSIIVLGDINPGATVVSSGNIVVLGTLYGMAYAGGSGDQKCFVAALDMQATQLKIGDITAGGHIKPGKFLKSKAAAKIAFVDQSKIAIEPITKELLNDIPL